MFMVLIIHFWFYLSIINETNSLIVFFPDCPFLRLLYVYIIKLQSFTFILLNFSSIFLNNFCYSLCIHRCLLLLHH
ncbi:hypothetical protein HMPREF3033_00219 [Veillonellaceae bacterium DNF00751]|nr:hypothetical protein HMPREF3033_00219 [Veillonellaceae bacterium DNF00751]